MRGVLLAGGEGTRLREVTGGKNKHTVEVGGQPMITYPLETLVKLGCQDVVIVTSPTGLDDIKDIVGHGDSFGTDVTYRIQPEAKGTADALAKAEGVSGTFPLIMGDVFMDPSPARVDKPTLFWNEFPTGHHHSVWHPETNTIIEKPVQDIGKRAVVFYFYDERVFDFIPTIQPSERGELELVDIHRYYLENGAEMKQHAGFFGDMGTPAGIKRVEDYLSQSRGEI
jgi:glucose-1-phosphate thymidylyltransferase